MSTDEWKALQNRLVEAWENVAHTLQKITDALTKVFESLSVKKENKRKSTQGTFKYSRKKNYYLNNRTPLYKVDKRSMKHLPYQRRNY